MGQETIRRYYLWHLTGPHTCDALGAFQGGTQAGFVFGGIFTRSLSGFIKTNWGFLTLQVLVHPRLILNPLFFDRLKVGYQAFQKEKRTLASRAQENGKARTRTYSILAIAVDPQVQGAGIGRRLMQGCEELAREEGFQRIRLLVHAENEQAIRFYEHLGYSREVARTWRGRMIKEI
jgi:ribosomal protein S18 acetylase RimI-like enzyme